MNIALRYYSRSGNTKKVADIISEEIAIRPYTIETPIDENIDKLFIGGAIYAGNFSKNLRNYIDTIPSDLVKKVYIFSTSGFNKNSNYKMKEEFIKKGIEVSEIDFFCKGRKVNEKEEINQMKEFAKKAMEE